MNTIFWRILWAVLAVVLIMALLPPVFRIIGFPLDGDLFLVLRICVAGIAVYYIIFGRQVPP